MQQLTLDDAIAKGRAMAVMCADQAESTDPTFAERAKAKVIELLQKHGDCSGEWLVNDCKLAGIVPHDDRAFGVVFRTLSTQKKIKHVDWVARSKGHGTGGGRVWGLV